MRGSKVPIRKMAVRYRYSSASDTSLPDCLTSSATDQMDEEGAIVAHEEDSGLSCSSCLDLGDVFDEGIYPYFSLDPYSNEVVEEPPGAKQREDATIHSDFDLTSLDALLPSVQELTNDRDWQLPSSELSLGCTEPNHCRNDTLLSPLDCRKRFKVCACQF